MSTRHASLMSAAIAVSALFQPILSATAAAATYTFDPDAPGSNDWALAGNWTPTGGPPVAGDTAVFANYATIAKQPNIYGSVAAEQINIDNSGADWNLVFNTGAALAVSAAGTGGMSLTGGGTSLVGPVTTLNNAALFNVGAGGVLQFQRNIIGGGAITKNGAGTLILTNAASSRSGALASTTINGGTLKITGNGAAIGGATGSPVPLTVNNGATFELGGVSVQFISISLKDGATLLSTAAGNSVVNAGNLVALDPGAKVSIDTGSVGHSLQFQSGTGSLSGGDASSVVTVKGNGKLQLSAGNTSYTGLWKLTGGNTQVDNNNAFGSAGTAKVELAGGRVTFNAGSNNGAATVSIPIKVSSTSTVAIDRLSSAGTITSRTIGAVEVGSATLNVDLGSWVTGGGGTNNTATLIAGALNVTGNAKINVPNLPIGGALTTPANMVFQAAGVTGSASNDLEKLGTGRMVINAASTYSGSTTVSEGTLQVTNTSGLGNTKSLHVSSLLELAAGSTNIWTSKADVSGGGTIAVIGGTGVGSNTINFQGSAISPGNSAGILTLNGNVALALDGAEKSALNIEVTGGGAVAGTDYDQLALASGRTLTGLSNAILNVSFSGVTQGDLTGDVLTIVTAPGANLGSQSFSSVNFLTPGSSADVTYNATSITLSNIVIPEPTSLSLLALGGMGLLRRRTVR